MNKDHFRFLVSGILFGFLVGYIVAYGVHEPRVKMIADRPPEAGNLSMTAAAIGPVGGGMPGGRMPGGGMPGGGAPMGGMAGADAQMAQVFQQIAALKATIEKSPKDADALTRLGNFFQDAGKFEDAVGYYRRVLELRPQDVDVRTDMGICLRETGRPAEAIQEFRRSLDINPNHWQTWLNLTIVSLVDLNDPETAASALGKVEALNPSFEGLPALKEAVRKARGGI
jgi:tetratricopeptide (TPR) repeat protein